MNIVHLSYKFLITFKCKCQKGQRQHGGVVLIMLLYFVKT